MQRILRNRDCRRAISSHFTVRASGKPRPVSVVEALSAVSITSVKKPETLAKNSNGGLKKPTLGRGTVTKWFGGLLAPTKPGDRIFGPKADVTPSKLAPFLLNRIFLFCQWSG